jgi:flagellar motor switch/type III secretory pathway protein FliN
MFDVACVVDLVIGTGSLTVRDCLALQPRSILRLRQASGADLDLSVSGIAIAYAEVVISDDTTAVRITRIAEPPRIETAA